MLSTQGQVKDLQRELEDSRAAQKESVASARESERRSKAMEAELIQLHEVRLCGASEHVNFKQTLGFNFKN